MFNSPFYHNYPRNASYNPYLNSSYQRPSSFGGTAARPQRSSVVDEAFTMEQARQMAERKARRAQYLPDEEEEQDADDEASFGYGGLGPRAQSQQQLLERQRQEALERKRMMMQRQQQIAAARQRELEERRRQARSGSPVAARAEDKSVPIHYGNDQSNSSPYHKAPEARQEPKPEPQPEPKPVYTEEHNEAASRIQHFYRIHRSFHALDELEKQFDALKKDFVYPTVIEFQKPNSDIGVISVTATHSPSDFTEPQEGEEFMDEDGPHVKLAYTSTNYGLHAYSDAMENLLIKLDGVESFGQQDLRQRRRGIVREIERESRRLRWYWEEAWKRYLIEKEVKEAGWDIVDSDKE